MTTELQIPVTFQRFMREVHGSVGEQWLGALPRLLDECARAWDLHYESPYENLTYNFVVRCRQSDGHPAALKIGVPHKELFTEMDVLETFGGRGAVTLLAADRERSAMLLERIEPGYPLALVEDDDLATNIAVGTMEALWTTTPNRHDFPHVTDLARGFERLRARFEGSTGPIPESIVKQAEETCSTLDAKGHAGLLLHGDLHHDNILHAGDGRWLAIDPKGVIGPKDYEVAAILTNPITDLPDRPDLLELLQRRLDVTSEELQVDREHLRRWAIVKAALATWWSIEDNSGDTDRWLRIANALDSIS